MQLATVVNWHIIIVQKLQFGCSHSNSHKLASAVNDDGLAVVTAYTFVMESSETIAIESWYDDANDTKHTIPTLCFQNKEAYIADLQLKLRLELFLVEVIKIQLKKVGTKT